MTPSLPLASYRIGFSDRHVRAMPAARADGGSFEGPGVDLRGDDAEAAIRAAAPVLAWIEEREPGAVVRSLSVKLRASRTSAGDARVLLSLEPLRDPRTGALLGSERRPRAMRFDPPYATELRDAGREAERVIGEACVRLLARRER